MKFYFTLPPCLQKQNFQKWFWAALHVTCISKSKQNRQRRNRSAWKEEFFFTMTVSCSFCKKKGEKGYYGYPKDPPQRAECLRLAGLPPESELKVKIGGLRICFRHYQSKDLYLTGDQVRLCKGK